MSAQRRASPLALSLRKRIDGRLRDLKRLLGEHPERVFVHPLGDNRELGEIVALPHLDWYTRGVNRTQPAPWPEGLALPLTFGQALEALERDAARMAEELTAKIETSARMVLQSDELVAAVLARDFVAERWPWPDRHMTDARPAGWVALECLEEAALFEGRACIGDKGRKKQDDARNPAAWPPEVAALAAAEWAQPGLNTALEGARLGDWLVDTVRLEYPLRDVHVRHEKDTHDCEWPGLHLATYGIGLLYLAWQEARQESPRNALARAPYRGGSERQFYRTTDRVGGLFSPLSRGKGGARSESPKMQPGDALHEARVTYVALRETPGLKRREISYRLPLYPETLADAFLHASNPTEKAEHREALVARLKSEPAEVEKILSYLRQHWMGTVYDNLGPRGLSFYRIGYQREFARSRQAGQVEELADGGVVFYIVAQEVLDTLYARQHDARGGELKARTQPRARAREELAQFVRFMSGPGLEVRRELVFAPGKRNERTVSSEGPPLVVLEEIKETRRVKGKGTQVATLGWKVYTPAAARTLLEMPNRHGTYQDERWLELERVKRHPHGALVADFLDEQLGIGWGRNGSTWRGPLSQVLAEAGLLREYEGRPVKRRNEWLRSALLPDLVELAKDKKERGLFARFELAGQDVATLNPKAPPAGEPLGWKLEVEAGPAHELTLKRTLPGAGPERKRIAKRAAVGAGSGA